jgi:hypothetical protein
MPQHMRCDVRQVGIGGNVAKRLVDVLDRVPVLFHDEMLSKPMPAPQVRQ